MENVIIMRSISGVETQNLFFDKFHTPCLYSRNIIVFEMQTIIMPITLLALKVYKS